MSPNNRLFSLAAGLMLMCSLARAELPTACDDPLIRAQRATLDARTFAQPVTERVCYRDKAGAHIIYLTESGDRPFPDLPLSRKIEAHLYRLEPSGALVSEGTVIDASEGDEAGARFWRSVSEVRDVDGDGLAEVILAYRFFNWDGDTRVPLVDDFAGRAKLVVFHKGAKAAIRATTHDQDLGRETSASPPYFQLPKSVQTYLVKKMERMYHEHLFGFDNSHNFRPVPARPGR